MRRAFGFTLVEVMIVLAVVGVLASILYPNLLRARADAYAGAVKLALRTLAQACESYRASHNPSTYPGSLAELTAPPTPYLTPSIDTATTGRAYEGYLFFYVLGDGVQPIPSMYYAYAVPAAPGITGSTTFYVDETGVIRAGPYPCTFTRAEMQNFPPVE